MIYVSTNARAPTVFIRVYRYRERLVLSSLLFIPLNSPVITDINKCILYKTMYKFHSSYILNCRRRLARTLVFYIYAKVQNNSRPPLFFLFFSLFFPFPSKRGQTLVRDPRKARRAPRFLIVDTIGSTRTRNDPRAIYI